MEWYGANVRLEDSLAGLEQGVDSGKAKHGLQGLLHNFHHKAPAWVITLSARLTTRGNTNNFERIGFSAAHARWSG